MGTPRLDKPPERCQWATFALLINDDGVAGRNPNPADAIAATPHKKEKATYKRCDANLERGRVVPAEEAVLRRGIGDRTNDRSVSGGSASPSTERWPAAIRSDSLAMRDPNTSVPRVEPVL